jgi:ATP-dependent protease ClpP protease subunit
MNFKTRLDNGNTDESEEDEKYSAQGARRLYCDVEKFEHYTSYDLYGELGAIDNYLQLIHTLHKMDRNDSIALFIDGPGGQSDSMMQIINAIELCKGRVTGILTGLAASAHSFLVLAMPELQVSPRARMMLHSGSYGYHGKEGEVQGFVQDASKFCKGLNKEFYSGFLSEKEILQMETGKDFYFDYAQIVKRLKSRSAFLSKLKKVHSGIVVKK